MVSQGTKHSFYHESSSLARERDLKKLVKMSEIAYQQHETFKDGQKVIRSSMDMQKINTSTRQIQEVELKYFINQSKNRLHKIRSGKELFSVLENTRKHNLKTLDQITRAHSTIELNLAGLNHDRTRSRGNSSDHDEHNHDQCGDAVNSYNMYDRMP